MLFRSLDWTANPLVAAYFACNDGHLDAAQIVQDKVLYCVDQFAFPEANLGNSPFEIDEVSMFVPRHATRRIEAQAGLFTIHPKPELAVTDDRVTCYILKRECVIDLGSTVEIYGIHRASLFPGLDSIASQICKWYIR